MNFNIIRKIEIKTFVLMDGRRKKRGENDRSGNKKGFSETGDRAGYKFGCSKTGNGRHCRNGQKREAGLYFPVRDGYNPA